MSVTKTISQPLTYNTEHALKVLLLSGGPIAQQWGLLEIVKIN